MADHLQQGGMSRQTSAHPEENLHLHGYETYYKRDCHTEENLQQALPLLLPFHHGATFFFCGPSHAAGGGVGAENGCVV